MCIYIYTYVYIYIYVYVYSIDDHSQVVQHLRPAPLGKQIETDLFFLAANIKLSPNQASKIKSNTYRHMLPDD